MTDNPFTPSDLYKNADGLRAEPCLAQVHYEGGVPIAISGLPEFAQEALDRIIAEALEAEREACAEVSEAFADNHLCAKCGHPKSHHPFRHLFQGGVGEPGDIASAIRARKSPPAGEG